jgi:hypothetical protein
MESRRHRGPMKIERKITGVCLKLLETWWRISVDTPHGLS